MRRGLAVGSRYCHGVLERELTVRKTTLFYPGDGFTVYEHNPCSEKEDCGGELIFRVETYVDPHLHQHLMRTLPTSMDKVVLMGPEGQCILTIRKKIPSLHQRWQGFVGDEEDHDISDDPSDGKTKKKKPIFSVRRSSIIGRESFVVELYDIHKDGDGGDEVVSEYHIEGSFPHRSCVVYETEGSGNKVIEIGRKVDISTNVTLGKDVFSLRLSPGFDAALAMGIVLALNKISTAHGDSKLLHIMPYFHDGINHSN